MSPIKKIAISAEEQKELTAKLFFWLREQGYAVEVIQFLLPKISEQIVDSIKKELEKQGVVAKIMTEAEFAKKETV